MKRKPTSITLDERELEMARYLAFHFKMSVSETLRWLVYEASYSIKEPMNEYLEQNGYEPLEDK